MHISLVGMSGCGKSYWGEKLAEELGFDYFCCDRLIFDKLFGCEGKKAESELASWLGEPGSETYSEREETYVRTENEVLSSLLQRLSGPSVIDTTGSVVYLPNETLKALKDKSKAVLLDADEAHLKELVRVYLEDPKPIIWNGFYKGSAENSFPELVRTRRTMYKELADVVVDFNLHRKKLKTAKSFIDEISKHK